MRVKQFVSFIGSLILIIGIFMPLLSIPMLGISMSYFDVNKNESILILLFVLISIIVTILNRYKYLWISIFGILLTLSYTFWNIHNKKADFESLIGGNMDDNPMGGFLQGFMELAINSVKIEWGWIIIILGVIAYIFASVLRDKKEKEHSNINE